MNPYSGRARALDISIRRLEPTDRTHIAALFDRLSPRSRYHRYLAPVHRLSSVTLLHLTAIDHVRHEAVGAFDDGVLVGAGHFVVSPDDRRTAEVSLEVADRYHRQGIGRRLLDELAVYARRRGICQFSATALAENEAIRSMVQALEWPTSLRSVGAELAVGLQLEAC